MAPGSKQVRDSPWGPRLLTSCLLSQTVADSIVWLKTLADGLFSSILKISGRINLYVYCADIVSRRDGSTGQTFLGDSKMAINPLPTLCAG